jgi:hypothetical protein
MIKVFINGGGSSPYDQIANKFRVETRHKLRKKIKTEPPSVKSITTGKVALPLILK